MSRFEKRITDEQIATARQKIADGSTLRATAAEIPCAPSTLSYRIKKAEQVDGAARRGQDDAWGEALVSARRGEDGGVDRVGPLEVLYEALQATKAGGQPDWATRLSAARAIAALRPQELEPTSPKEIPSEIVVFDLEPGAHPVMHRPRSTETETSSAEEEPRAPSAEASDEYKRMRDHRLFHYQPPDEPGLSTLIGEWVPARPNRPVDPNAIETITLIRTDDPATVEHWLAELSAGRLPASGESG
jgi:hypothetical protein